jgi:predicted methyltransferase
MIRRTGSAASAALALAAGAALGGLALAACAPSAEALQSAADDVGADAAIAASIAAPTRTPANLARDQYRHPRETLGFFGVRPDQTVVEIWPGGGWYTEILAPLLAERGQLWVAANGNGLNGVRGLMQKDPETYGKIRLAAFPAFEAGDTRVPDGTADVVLTFRNVHNWRMGYQRDDKQDYAPEAFRQMFRMLKPGGVLGIVDHRLPESAADEREKTSGYIKTSTVRRLAEEAGFRFAGASEVNANPRDTADWPNGVWTLPPSLALKDQDREKYLAIGESDRMTLKFVKPR